MILVTGATGNLGSHLLYHLLQENEKVVALYRNEKKKQNVLEIFGYYSENPEKMFEKIAWRKADLTDVLSLENAFEGITSVFHCAAIVGFKNRKYEQYRLNNIVGTTNIVNLAIDFNVKKLVYVSSIAALGVNKEGLTTEEHHINPDNVTSFYSKSKYYAELEVWRGMQEGLNAVIINPSVILAPYSFSGFTEKIIKFVIRKGIKYYTCGKKGYVDVNDVAKIAIDLMKSDISGERFILNSQNLSFKSVFDLINRKIGKPYSEKKIKKSTLIALKHILNVFTFGKSLLNNQLIFYAVNDELYSSEKLKNAIDVNFKTVRESIDYIVDIYRKKLSLEL